MIDDIEQLLAWSGRWVHAISWCESHLQPGTWRYLGDRIEIDSDRDYFLFKLSTHI